ncbi:MAG: glycosyltransferase [Tannerellaceae bacterium]|jgi:glycosyltransferase involved in cell wall biosynthesis|nr:glycosyltransferase [Tannerellaceae bacterium]
MKNPLISVITVVYNGATTLEQTMLSVINQTYQNIEYIIIDGGSNDGTVDIIKKYEKHLAYWISEPDKGIYDAMNKGIAKAKGEIIGLINSDDWYETDSIESVVTAFKKNETEIVHGNIRLIDEGRNKSVVCVPVKDLTQIRYKGMILWHPSFFVHKNVYANVGKFNINNLVASDYEFTLKSYLSGVKFHYINRIITNFRLGGVSDRKILLGFAECRRIAIRYGVSRTLVNFFYIKRRIGIMVKSILSKDKI